MLNFLATCVEKQLNNRITNMKLSAVTLEDLNSFMSTLNEKLEESDSEEAQREAFLFNHACGEIIRGAYKNFPAFKAQWDCKLWFRGSLETSGVFVVYLEHFTDGRQYHFRFAGLN